MIRIDDSAACCGCGACANVCPRSCITMETDKEGFRYPAVKTDACIGCGLCNAVCPFQATETDESRPLTYAVKSLDDGIRMESSSGGVFSLFSSEVLKKGGIVFGAAFSDDHKEVYHISAETEAELSRLRTSKYLQSRTEDVYRNVKNELATGRFVLYTGTPCQILALRKYLRKEYDNLYCVDVICHGVPSPALWKRYLGYLENTYGGTVTDVNFRYKKYGWENYGMNRTQNGTDVFVPKDTDPYMLMFLRDVCLRPSCYACKAKECGSGADVTLGDFWGINRVTPEMNDGKGTSAVVIRTEKGARLFDAVKDNARVKEVTYDVVKQYNPALCESVARPPERDSFFVDFQTLSWDELVRKYAMSRKKTIRQQMKFCLKVILRKIGIIFR